MKSVGIIVNPAAGKDLRRLVAFGSTATHSEKINAVVRILRALAALGVSRVRIAPDPTNLGQRAIEASGEGLESMDAACLELPWLLGSRSDTERAAALMCEQDFGCILVLGGDGTSRAVASHCGDVPLIPISTGTNNAFPRMLEGTLAGMAAACVVRALDGEEALQRAPILRLLADGEEVSHALVDIAVIDTLDSGALAVWEGHSIRELFLAQARPDSIGLSAIGGCLTPLEPGCGEGLHLQLGEVDDPGCTHVTAPMAPGLVVRVAVSECLRFTRRAAVCAREGVFAFDGEREMAIDNKRRWEVAYDPMGPRVVNVEQALALGIERGLFRDEILPRAQQQP
ncbi:MAG: NAD(+)/NADH kinase [Halioglobus sp.]|nr:NAD(+)/NADH kinase [Halioglobus sp.]